MIGVSFYILTVKKNPFNHFLTLPHLQLHSSGRDPDIGQRTADVCSAMNPALEYRVLGGLEGVTLRLKSSPWWRFHPRSQCSSSEFKLGFLGDDSTLSTNLKSVFRYLKPSWVNPSPWPFLLSLITGLSNVLWSRPKNLCPSNRPLSKRESDVHSALSWAVTKLRPLAGRHTRAIG